MVNEPDHTTSSNRPHRRAIDEAPPTRSNTHRFNTMYPPRPDDFHDYQGRRASPRHTSSPAIPSSHRVHHHEPNRDAETSYRRPAVPYDAHAPASASGIRVVPSSPPGLPHSSPVHPRTSVNQGYMYGIDGPVDRESHMAYQPNHDLRAHALDERWQPFQSSHHHYQQPPRTTNGPSRLMPTAVRQPISFLYSLDPIDPIIARPRNHAERPTADRQHSNHTRCPEGHIFASELDSCDICYDLRCTRKVDELNQAIREVPRYRTRPGSGRQISDGHLSAAYANPEILPDRQAPRPPPFEFAEEYSQRQKYGRPFTYESGRGSREVVEEQRDRQRHNHGCGTGSNDGFVPDGVQKIQHSESGLACPTYYRVTGVEAERFGQREMIRVHMPGGMGYLIGEEAWRHGFRP